MKIIHSYISNLPSIKGKRKGYTLRFKNQEKVYY